MHVNRLCELSVHTLHRSIELCAWCAQQHNFPHADMQQIADNASSAEQTLKLAMLKVSWLSWIS